MTMPARRRARSVFRGQRRRTAGTWSRTIDALTTVPGASKVLLNTLVLSNEGIGETVRRTRGYIHVKSDQEATSEQPIGAFGMVVANDLALAAGAASIPGPATDLDDDGWFVWEPITTDFAFRSAVGFESAAGRLFNYDSRAMRKVEPGFGLAIMVEISTAAAAIVQTSFSLYSTRL